MKKPHEETWEVFEASGDQFEIQVADTEERVAISFFVPERSRLAAQAPAMARLLLELQWAAQYGHDETAGACPSCGYPESEAKHRHDCELAVVLRAAGCLP